MIYILKNKFIYIFIISILVLISIYYVNHKRNISTYLNQKSKTHYLNYKSVINQKQNISNLVFDSFINTKKIISLFSLAENKKEKNEARKKLFLILRNKYKKLNKYNIKQIHFHLKNNESFLRMNRADKYADNLTNIRPTVKYVNKAKKQINALEIGNFFNGLRFVYPLFDSNNKYIGSVEISFSLNSLIDLIAKKYKVKTNFLIRKEAINNKIFEQKKNNYIQSPYKNYYYEKSIMNLKSNLNIKKTIFNINVIENKNKPTTIFLENIDYITTIIPIKNPVNKKTIAFLELYEKDNILNSERKIFYILCLVTSITLLLILYLFKKQNLINKKLEETNLELDERINEEVNRSRKKDISILNHSKMASIGEMLNNISHHWRQPLNMISTSASGLVLHKEYNTLDDKNFKLLTETILKKTEYLSYTIDNFREYVDDNNLENKRFEIKDKLEKAINIVEASFQFNYIQIKKDFIEEEFYCSGNSGDLIQVFLNILNNSKDALTKNNTLKNRKVKIKLRKNILNNIAIITIKDNAGGIPENILNKIFNPYFTTKHELMGTGISLYLCYEIITKMKGKIYAKNMDEGAIFFIELPLK